MDSGNGAPMQSFQLRNLVEYTRVLRNPDPDHYQVKIIYGHMRVEVPRFGQTMETLDDPLSPTYQPNEERRCHLHAAYCLGLGLSLMFNGILRAHDPTDPALKADAEIFVDDCIALAEYGLPLRPLGSIWMSFCLIPAWVSATSAEQKARAHRAILDYESTDKDIFRTAYWFQKRLQSLRDKIVAESEESSNYPSPESSLDSAIEDAPDDVTTGVPGCVVM